MLFFPWRVETLMERWPWANFLLIGVTVLLSLSAMGEMLPDQLVEDMILRDWSPAGLAGHLFLHAGFGHLAGNMIYLWVFGNTVCAKVGNFAFLALYLFFGLAAASAHLLLDGEWAIGASGAVNGVIGFYLAMHPLNKIHCCWFLFFSWGMIPITGFWLILLWVALDLAGALGGWSLIAYWAHLGGFAGGFALGLAALATGWVQMNSYDNESVLELLGRSPPG